MSKKEVQEWLDEFLSSRTWLSNRYSPDRIIETLERWTAIFEDESEAAAVPLEDVAPLRFFRPSYLRLAPGQDNDDPLRRRARAAVERIGKRSLLEKARHVSGIDGLDASRLEKWSHKRIASRFSKWEDAIREAVPGLCDEEIFRFFRLRYLYLPEDRFIRQAIPLGVKNTTEYQNRIRTLELLGIGSSHPGYEDWMGLAEWKFRRRAKKLKQAVERFRDMKLGFPPTADSINQRDYQRYLKICANGDAPDSMEEMVYKLILYFSGLTRVQLAAFLSEIPEGNPWRTYDLDGALGRLVELGLVEEQAIETGEWYLPSRSIQTEIILETWLEKLRSEIKIGTREALDYLPAGYQRHGTTVIARKDIPRATERIMRDRRRMVSEFNIDRGDPRYARVMGLSRREIENELREYGQVTRAFETGRLALSRDLEEQLEIFLTDDLKPDDRDVFALVVNLGEASISQLGKIFRRHVGGRRGFALKSSLKRLCAVELLAENREGLYTLHPSLRDLNEAEGMSDLSLVVGLL